MRYIYADESKFSDPKPCVGTGMLATDNEITDSIVRDALNDLRNDPDRFDESTKDIDDKTIANKYFHASFDSKNAHSHLLTQINKNVKGTFDSDFFDTNLTNSINGDEDFFRITFMHNTIRGILTREKTKFYIENRQGLTIDTIKKNHTALEDNLIMCMYDQPYIPTFIPQVEFELVDKRNPGVQCADFLLWIINRRVNGDSTWYNRISAQSKTNFHSESEQWGGDSISINGGLSEPQVYYDLYSFPKDPDTIVNQNKMGNFFIHAVKVINELSRNPLNEISHFQNAIDEVASEKLNIKYPDYIEKLFSVYLKIFDMVNLINEKSTDSDKEFLLLSRKYISLAMRKDLIHGVRTLMWYQRLRFNILEDSPKLLQFQV